MKTSYGFTEFENIEEFKTWLKKQKVTRKINRLQVHHMWLPDYNCWAKDNALRRQKNTKDYHMQKNGWGDIAQHFSIFPNGHIVTGRSLNKTPIGIVGWNTNAICCEIYGNFDKGHDKMTKEQQKAVIAFYGELCKKFDLTPSTATIRPHCWFTAGGRYLGDYVPSRAAKTCPGTNFMGIGNTKKAFTEEFYPMVKDYMKGKDKEPEAIKPEKPIEFKAYLAKPTVDGLNCRKGPGVDFDIEQVIDTDVAITIVEEKKLSDGSTWCKAKSGYWVNKRYMEFVRYI